MIRNRYPEPRVDVDLGRLCLRLLWVGVLLFALLAVVLGV